MFFRLFVATFGVNNERVEFQIFQSVDDVSVGWRRLERQRHCACCRRKNGRIYSAKSLCFFFRFFLSFLNKIFVQCFLKRNYALGMLIVGTKGWGGGVA